MEKVKKQETLNKPILTSFVGIIAVSAKVGTKSIPFDPLRKRIFFFILFKQSVYPNHKFSNTNRGFILIVRTTNL